MSQLCYQLAAVFLLCAFLLWKHRARHGGLSSRQRRHLEAERAEIEARLTGHGFEVTEEIKARLKKIREEHEVIARRRKTDAHEEFAAAVRRSLLRLGFFGVSSDHAEHESRGQH
jgi:hypothetical protein